MVRFCFVLILAALVVACLVGCGGGGNDDSARNIADVSIEVDHVSSSAIRPTAGLIRINDDGSYTTEAIVRLRSGYRVVVNLPMPRYRDYDYMVVIFEDLNNNRRYDYRDYEDIAVWDGWLRYEYGSWAGYGLSDHVFLFSDVTENVLLIYDGSTIAVAKTGSTSTSHRLIDLAGTRRTTIAMPTLKDLGPSFRPENR